MAPESHSAQQVSTGSFIVTEKQNLRLEALLGTCVGVAICDREAKICGLYHILLPEPTGTEFPAEPNIFASTGMPLFMEALREAGARNGRMEVTIAGGALVGPVSFEDLQLDIGGRTTETVRQFLSKQGKNGVTVKHSETGGFFSCRLTLDLSGMECFIEPVGQRFIHTETRPEKLTGDDIDQIIKNVRPIPQIAMKIIRMIHSDEYSIKEIAREVRQDQIISAKVINVCNSVFFSPKSKIESIDQALLMLGEKMIMQLVLSASFDQFYQTSDHGYSLCKGGLFHHAFSTASVAEKLAIFTEKVPSDVAYTAGLLHDIGKVVLDQNVAKVFPLFYRSIITNETGSEEVEVKVLGISHSEAGRRLAILWNLPDNLTDAIAWHHQPEKAEIDPELTSLIYLADLLISRFQVGKDLERMDTDRLEYSLNRLGQSPDKLPEIIGYIPWKNISETLEA